MQKGQKQKSNYTRTELLSKELYNNKNFSAEMDTEFDALYVKIKYLPFLNVSL